MYTYATMTKHLQTPTLLIFNSRFVHDNLARIIVMISKTYSPTSGTDHLNTLYKTPLHSSEREKNTSNLNEETNLYELGIGISSNRGPNSIRMPIT
jgi:hypothetical protein